MKSLLASLLVLSCSFSIFAQSGFIKDYNFQVEDITKKNLKKEDLFRRMERSMTDLEDSICANRAHLWAWDFFRFYNIMPGKIFIFFTSQLWIGEKQGWMYHVSPFIVENGKEFVMEASYPEVTKPLTVHEWIENELDGRIKGTDCIEIDKTDTDLTEYFYARYNLPRHRKSGKPGAVCYIKKVPGYYWFPTSIAYHELGLDEDGEKIKFDPKEFDIDDVYSACLDAFSGKLGPAFSGAKAKCKKYLRY